MRSSTRRIRDLTVFALLAAMILTTQIALRAIPGVQLNGMLISAITLTYRWRALVPIYVYALLHCLFYGFFPWNIPYFYIWIPLWGMFMVAGKLGSRLPQGIKTPLFMVLCGLYGLSFGALYAPSWMIANSMNLEQILIWWFNGFITTDIIYGINNYLFGVLIIPISDLLKRLDRK